VHVPWQQRDHGGFRHQGEPVGCNRGEQGRSVAVDKERAFASAAGFKGGGQHSVRGLRKLALGRHLRAEVGESFHGSQKTPEIVFVYGHAPEKTRAEKE
jgi:hypothetical protein